ncbi:hypothetical protein [Kitasatospora sp. NPDC057198]
MVTDVGATPFGAEFGHTTATPSFTGWAAHRPPAAHGSTPPSPDT